MAPAMDRWLLVYEGWDAAEQPLREALCTLGNGYFAVRGAAEEAPQGAPHYPGTYVAGAFDRRCSEVAGRAVDHADLVNWPSWLRLSFRPVGGEWLDLDAVEVLSYRQVLDPRDGTLTRSLRVRDGAGRETDLRSQRLVSMADPHIGAIRWELGPRWSEPVEIDCGIDVRMANQLVLRHRDFDSRHLRPLEMVADGEVCHVFVESLGTRRRIAEAVRTRVWCEAEDALVSRVSMTDEAGPSERIRVAHHHGRPIVVEKVLALHTDRDLAIDEPVRACRSRLSRAPGFDALHAESGRSWERLWARCDVQIEGEGTAAAQRALRLHAFHLVQTASPHVVELDVGVPARGLHGEGYRGHVFWDELFVEPYLTLSVPEISRALLMYRYRRLDEARRRARDCGLPGAMYPWRSATDGREEAPPVQLNPRSGTYYEDDTHLQRHVSAAVAHNVWRYYEATGDHEFLSFYGAEIIVEVARLFAGLARWDAALERYRIGGVVGPDEFHTRLPGAEEPGLPDNAYTNVMAVWVLGCARRVLGLVPERRRHELCEELQLGDDELGHMERVSRSMYVPFHAGVISQFHGYGALEELDWEGLRQRHGDIHRLDRILLAEGDDPNRYKASKQADVLMLFYLFTLEELVGLFASLGYDIDEELVRRTVDYYRRRTSHGSTLSRVVHSWVQARTDRRRSWSVFEDSLRSDLEDVKGGSTEEGVHLGAMAGTLDLIQRCYAGVRPRIDALWIKPRLPKMLDRVRFVMRYRGDLLELDVRRDSAQVEVLSRHPDRTEPLRVGYGNQIFELEGGERRTLGAAEERVGR